MKTFKHIVLAFAAILMVASCAIDEMWQGSDIQDEERVLTFKPRFEDFEAATKAIGDGNKVNKLLVHVYEGDSNAPLKYSYHIDNKKIDGPVSIPFFKTKEYKVYFFAYNDESSYVVSDIGLKGGVTVTYPDPDAALNFDALESLDAFYSVKKVNLSDKSVDTGVSLTRPFAQVNLTADKAQLLAAKATKVEIAVKAATSYDFVNAPTEEELAELTFTFGAAYFFQNNEEISEGIAYLGTTYLFVPSDVDALPATVTLYDEEENVLKGPSEVSIPLASNNRTNLVFSGIEPAGPSWDDNEVNVPGAGADGWIHITRPEQLAAFLLNTTADGAQVCIDNDIDMSEIPEEVTTNLAKASKSVKSLTLNGNNKTISGLTLSAFFNEATNLNVYDLTLSGITVKGTSHVGVLVNTLKGESSFSKVNILKSSAATTNGAAGGMVGYIVRKTETDRSESMAISFTDCQVISTSVTGKESAGKFVGKFSGYDNGETLTFTGCSTSEASASADNASPYVEGNEGAWLADIDYSSYNSWLGGEVYYRAVVTFEENRFQPKWDGKKSVEPIYEDSSKKVAQIWSAFDLAYLQDKSLTTINFNENVDLSSKVFKPIQALSNIDGKSKILYNLTVDTMQIESSSSVGGAFVRGISGGTVKNLTFDGANIFVTYDPNGSSGNAYAGTLAATVYGTTTISGVKCINGSVHAICKMGGLIGRVSDGSLTCNDCHVEGYLITNEKAPDYFKETFTETAQVSTTKKVFITFTIDLTATAKASFNSEGEVGGLIGFIAGSVDIDDCTVKTTTINAYGQLDDHSGVHAVGTAKYKFIFNRTANLDLVADYTIAGRHVNKFIGDIRPTSNEIVTIDNCSADAERTDANCFWNTHTCKAGSFDLVGCAYYIGGKVQMDGVDLGKTFGESKGSVKINGTEVLDEAIANISIEDVLSDLI